MSQTDTPAPDLAAIETVVDAYLAALTETDDDARAKLAEQAWADESHFTDPLLHADGRDDIAALTPLVTGQFPGHAFARTTGIDTHNGYVRFGWELRAPDGTVPAAGIDVGVLAPDGRLNRIVGFFGEPTAL
jgi:hypothetical protein